MTEGQSESFAAAEGREFLSGELQGKDPEYVREFAGLIDDPELLNYLNYCCSLWANKEENFLDTYLGKELVRNAATGTIDDAFRAGNISQMKGMTGLTNQQKDGEDLISEVASRLQNEGAIGLVLGPPGSGKTALTLDLARAWAARTGGAIIGNTGWEGFDEVVRSDRELLESMGHIQGPVLAVIDETAQELSGFGAGNKAAEEFSDSLTFVRKREEDHGPYPKRGSVLMVNHTRTKTAKPFRDLASFGVEKPNRNDPTKARLLESQGGKDTWNEEFTATGLTDTREEYAEHEASEFTILGVEEDDDQEEQVDEEELQKDEHRAAVIRAVADQGMNYEEASALVPWSSDWVGDVYRSWRDDDRFTELVSKEEVSET